LCDEDQFFQAAGLLVERIVRLKQTAKPWQRPQQQRPQQQRPQPFL
jgi:hypothetical protein